MHPDPALVIGLTGGVASGKSTVATLFAEESATTWKGPGIEVVDADDIARRVTAQPEVVQRIAESLGPDCLAEDGNLDRKRVAALVFEDAEKRRALEGIVHPLVRAEIEQHLATAANEQRSLLLDIPLLLESGWDSRCDVLVHVDVPDEEREARALSRGWAGGERERREAAQTPVAEKRRRAHHVVDNGAHLSHTRAAVREVLRSLNPGDGSD